MNTITQTVGRGYVVLYTQNGTTKCTAVVSGPMAQSLQRKVGGRIVNVKGMKFRYAQNRQVRVIVDQDAVKGMK